MKYLLVILTLTLSACAAQDPMDSLIADQKAQEHYEQVERACRQMGAFVYLPHRTGTKIRKKLRRHEMLTARCAKL